jgi:UDP-N-acetylmuramyl pentapeptide synthase
VRPENLRGRDGDGFAFDLCAPEGRVAVEVAGLGETAVANALAAAAAALAAGVPLSDVATGLRGYRPVPGRLEPIALPGGGILINDTYNANPQSTEVALRLLARLAVEGGARNGGGAHAIAVLGDMGELGDASEAAHREAGRLTATLGIDRLYALGEHAPAVADGAADAGMDRAHVHVGHDWEETGQLVSEAMGERDRVLVKGSRAMRMERIVELLTEAASHRAERAPGADGDSGHAVRGEG